MVNEITGNPSGVIFKPRRDWDQITRRKASVEKARKAVGYSPKTKMKDGIAEVHRWIKSNWDDIEGCARF
jgi:nucleoside-diphosphate-sugar epimerase